MTRDELAATETNIHEAISTVSNAWHELGVVACYEAIAWKLRTKAGELYADGQHDDQAKLYRTIAAELEVEGKIKRREYDAKASKDKETAYGKLQELVNTLMVSVPYDNN